jgi:hypothetical protein
LVACHRRQIASVRDPITNGGDLDTPPSAVLALLSATIAKLAGEVMHAGVCAAHEIVIGRCLIATGRGLVSIRERLISISERLIALKRTYGRNDDLSWVSDRPIHGIHGTIARH